MKKFILTLALALSFVGNIWADSSSKPKVMTGIDVLEANGFKNLQGKKIGVVTNLACLDHTGVATLDVLLKAKGITVVAVFSPEHGLTVNAADGATINSSTDEKRHVKIYSLYGKDIRPTPAQLEGLDALVIDLPDVGTRFYTYVATAAGCMEEAAKLKLPVFLLDRPDRINGFDVEGPVLKPAYFTLVGYASVPIRHGMTLGEMLSFINGEHKIGAKLTVIKAKGWKRKMWFDQTSLAWTNPSPNLRNLTATTLYPGLCLLESEHLSVGRGTDKPFERFGAPWIDVKDAARLAQDLNGRRMLGVKFNPVMFTPNASVFEHKKCGGVDIILTDRAILRPVAMGFHFIDSLKRLFGDKFEIADIDRLLGDPAIRQAFLKKVPVEKMVRQYQAEEKSYKKLRKQYLLY